MPYNLTLIANNATNLVGLTTSVNNVLMRGWFGVLFMLALGFVVYGAFLFGTQDAKKAIAGTSFILFTTAIFFRAIGLVPNLALFITLIGCAVAVAFTWRE